MTETAAKGVGLSSKTESGDDDNLQLDAWVDPVIKYPSYRSFDDIIDVERLRSLDGYITQRLRRRLEHDTDLKFYTGPYTLPGTAAGRPGSRMVYLAASEQPDRYFDLDRTELWKRTANADEFGMLMDFIGTLPFEATGRMLIMYDDVARDVPPHRDHLETEICHEFIWFRTNLKKPFYMLDPSSGERKYVSSYSAWFDSVNQFHGSDGYDGLSFSIRVDGRFTDEFRNSIPKPPCNAASTPSYWECLGKGENQ